jgi:hypothetical protein
MESVIVNIAVEGPSDEPVIRRIVKHVGLSVGYVYIAKGKDKLDKKLSGYNNAARFEPWLVLRDLDTDAYCAPELMKKLLSNPAAKMNFRIAVRSIEAWLLADHEGLSQFLKVSTGKIPNQPDKIKDPKKKLVELANLSPKNAIKKDMVPKIGNHVVVGPGYLSRVSEYALHFWQPARAAKKSDSLCRCIKALERWT